MFAIVAFTSLMIADSPLVKEARRNIDAQLMEIFGPSVLPAPSIPMALVEIDDRTMVEQWGSDGALTPRDHLASLLRAVLRQQPPYLLLDLDLGFGGSDPALAAVLSDPALIGATHVLLARSQRIDPRPQERADAVADRAHRPHTLLAKSYFRFSPFEALVASGPAHRHLHWVTADLVRDEEDQMFRTLVGWRIGCDQAGKPMALLAPGYLIRILEQARHVGRDGGDAADMLTQALAKGSRNCLLSAPGGPPPALFAALRLWGVRKDDPWFRETGQYLARRSVIAFPMENLWENGAAAPSIQAPPYAAFVRVSAATITTARETPAARALKNRLVIIGRTDGDSGDHVRSPIGTMPGSALLANAIYTVTTLKRPLRSGALLTMLTLAIALGALIVDAFIAPEAHTVLLAHLLFVPASSIVWAVLLFFGHWMDLSIALFAFSITKLLIDALESRVRIRSRRKEPPCASTRAP
ncbi:CHASE2 domain-containing protein [Sphingomonas azotifigens]|uniref:CHASE2 domain-containing protein n=1 Tax=Sphingomonas azotifigens TaxID=330920 RepID=UPI001FE9236C|nr:CHASE2 domain-containing protein [Sphingomonas azotifigens]